MLRSGYAYAACFAVAVSGKALALAALPLAVATVANWVAAGVGVVLEGHDC